MKTDSSYGAPWNASFHGGHSSEFCDHAHSTLREILEAAVARGMRAYGIAEHAPRVEPRFLYPEEIELEWDVDRLLANFEAYADATRRYAEEFADRLEVYRGFEIEVVPASRYVEVMAGFRERYDFDYVVGSVHYVDEALLDYSAEWFSAEVERHGGLEPLALRYYETVIEMVERVRPEIVGHIDLIRKYPAGSASLNAPAIRKAVGETLASVKRHHCILDVNTAAYRKGLDTPFPDRWIVELARDMGIPFCFGDDSHRSDEVGAGILEARDFLLGCGVDSITVLTKENGGIGRKSVGLA